MTLPPEIFKAYDIRGIVGKTLTPPIVRAIGQALGSLARERGRDTIVVGRDGRLSGPELAAALADGIRAAGANVIDIGMVATPMTYFAAHALGTQLQRDGHRQPQPARLQRPQDGGRRRHAVGRRHPGAAHAHRGRRARAAAPAATAPHDIAPAYFDRIAGDVRLARPMKIAVDCGNGVAGAFAPDAVPAPGLRGHRALLRGRRHAFPITIRIRRSRRTCAT